MQRNAAGGPAGAAGRCVVGAQPADDGFRHLARSERPIAGGRDIGGAESLRDGARDRGLHGGRLALEAERVPQ